MSGKFTAAALLLLLSTRCATAADLVLVEQHRPDSGVVRLGDIAAILNAGDAELNRLSDLPLMPAPAAGATIKLRAQEVRELLDAHGIDLSKVRFRGASTVKVLSPSPEPPEVAFPAANKSITTPARSRASTSFRGAPEKDSTANKPAVRRAPRRARLSSRKKQEVTEQLADNLTKYVQIQLEDPMMYVIDLELKDRNAQVLAAGDADMRISTTTKLNQGLTRFLIELQTPRGDVRFPVFARVVEARPAVMVRREVRRGMVITAADIHVAPLPTKYRPRGIEEVAEDLDEVIGKEAAKRLSPGDVVTDVNTLPPLMVQRGEIVSVSASRGAIRVRTPAKSRVPGRLGEIIEVETLDTRQKIQARVVGRGELAVFSAGAGAVREVAQSVQPLRIR